MDSNYSIVFFIMISRLSVYFLLGTGWRSFSKYSLMGSYRSVAQAISYEVRIFMVLFMIIWFMNRLNLYDFMIGQLIFFYFL